MPTIRSLCGILTAAAALLVSSAPSGDDVHWSPQFGPPGVSQSSAGLGASAEGQIMVTQVCAPETNCPVQFWDGRTWKTIGVMSGDQHYALAIEKRGPLWYVAGSFDSIDGVRMSNIATWDGARWSAIGGGVNGAVMAMAFHKDELYVAGWPAVENSTFIRKWNGAAWVDLSAPFTSTSFRITHALLSDGNYLYAGGDISLNGANVARWNGSQWEPVGNRIAENGLESVISLAMHEGALYAVLGASLNLGSTPSSIWRWDGNAWTKINATFRGGGPSSLITWNDTMYVLGSFTNVNSQTARALVRFDGANFEPVPGVALADRAVATPDAIYLGGRTAYVSNSDSGRDWMLAYGVSVWDENGYDNLYSPEISNGVGLTPTCFANMGSKLYAGGNFRAAGDVTANAIAAWDGRAWSSLGVGLNFRASSSTPRVSAMQPVGNELFAGGSFDTAGEVPAANIAIWDGALWRAAGDGFNSNVTTVVEFNGTVFAGGSFTRSGTRPVFYLAAWNGTGWEEAGCCLTAPAGGGVTDAAAMGNRLFIGGRLFGQPVNGVMGTNTVFEFVGGEFVQIGRFDRPIAAMAAFNSELYVSGDFKLVNGQALGNLAKWDGASWSAVASPLNVGPTTMTVHQGKLYIGGIFTNSSTVANLNGIARLDGDWRPLGSGFRYLPVAAARVSALYSMGDDLYAGGIFVSAGAADALNFARWNESVNFYDSSSGAIRFTEVFLQNGTIILRGSGPGPIVLEVSADLRNWAALETFDGTIDYSLPRTERFQFFRARLQ